jgi:L,D-peptidoglycan transpeptidase YkuD (ErfK/YbiS/YcfS/YnhG family)
MRMTISRRELIAGTAGLVAAGPAFAAAPVDIVVTPARIAQVGVSRFRCALGRGGIAGNKHEGDGVTPVGVWPLREVFYRPDRIGRPMTSLPVRPLAQSDGWCDAPGDANYNKPVRLPYLASAEQLWRADHVYDLIVVVGYNDGPIVSGAGSAIFLHCARSSYQPTAGCVAFARANLLRILARVDQRSRLDVRLS